MDSQRKPDRRRLLVGLGKALALLALVYVLFSLLGLRVSRVSRSPVELQGSELERSSVATAPVVLEGAGPSNVIVFVADGLGFAHLSAARAALHGMGGAAVWDRFTSTGWHQPHSATGFLVDSAGAATALATGVPTHNDRIGVDTEHAPLPNLFERAAELGYRGGIVTDSYVWDATPAAFATHTVSRDNAASILEQLTEAPIELLVGELEDLGEGDVPEREPTLSLLAERFRVF